MSMMDDFEKQIKDAENSKQSDSLNNIDLWDVASELFPRQQFPWHVLPTPIAASLQQVARSCATSDVSMPGAALAIMASVLGRTISVSPKDSWRESTAIWAADIRQSGDGKTPPVRMLLSQVYEKQNEVEKHYEAELEQWNNKKKADRGTPPKRPAAFYATDLTLEGLRADIQNGHGGMVCVLDEISSMITSQNQYKKKGSDRETWISMWDGYDARITRAGQTMTIKGARISIFGGIQPEIFRMVFGGDNGVYCADGTIYRFLFTYELKSFFKLTDESWTDENRRNWESTLKNAIAWSDNIISNENWKTHVLMLTNEGQALFFNYRNEIYKKRRHCLNCWLVSFQRQLVTF